jgi:hypothetical protein
VARRTASIPKTSSVRRRAGRLSTLAALCHQESRAARGHVVMAAIGRRERIITRTAPPDVPPENVGVPVTFAASTSRPRRKNSSIRFSTTGSAEELLDQLPLPWADRIAGMPRRPIINGAAGELLRDARRNARHSHDRQKPGTSKPLSPSMVAAPATSASNSKGGVPFRGPRGGRHAHVWPPSHDDRRAGHDLHSRASPLCPSPCARALRRDPSWTDKCHSARRASDSRNRPVTRTFIFTTESS